MQVAIIMAWLVERPVHPAFTCLGSSGGSLWGLVIVARGKVHDECWTSPIAMMDRCESKQESPAPTQGRVSKP